LLTSSHYREKSRLDTMTLIIFKYALPILLGYTLFVGISGRYIPFLRPRALLKRPKWFLGLWTGIAGGAIMLYGLQIAYGMDINDVSELAAPAAWIFAAVMLPGILLTLLYRSKVKSAVAIADQARIAKVGEQAESYEIDDTLVGNEAGALDLDETIVVDHTAGILMSDDDTTIWQDVSESDLAMTEADETQLFVIEPDVLNDETLAIDNAELLIDENTQSNIEESQNTNLTAEESVDDNDATLLIVDEIALEAEIEDDLVLNENAEQEAAAKVTAEVAAKVAANQALVESELEAARTQSMLEIKQLNEALDAEISQRKELENRSRTSR